MEFRRNGRGEALVHLHVKANNDCAASHQRWQCTTVEIFGQNPQILRIGADVTLFKGDATRLQEALRLDTRTTSWFRVEMIFHM
jgi:hypothetical protein